MKQSADKASDTMINADSNYYRDLLVEHLSLPPETVSLFDLIVSQRQSTTEETTAIAFAADFADDADGAA